ncbi:MAG: FixH family protein [Chloroflexi bacterium]|nr:FixH family protein [Chloroflexota bacterium]
MKQLILMGFVLLACTMLAACGREKSISNTSNLNVTLMPAPGQAIIVQLTDASGQPVNDAVVSIEGNMQHAGMAPVTANGVRDEADGAKDGKYQVPFSFTMLGDWVLTVSIQRADGTKVQQDINATVNEQGMTVKTAGQ